MRLWSAQARVGQQACTWPVGERRSAPRVQRSGRRSGRSGGRPAGPRPNTRVPCAASLLRGGAHHERCGTAGGTAGAAAVLPVEVDLDAAVVVWHVPRTCTCWPRRACSSGATLARAVEPDAVFADRAQPAEQGLPGDPSSRHHRRGAAAGHPRGVAAGRARAARLRPPRPRLTAARPVTTAAPVGILVASLRGAALSATADCILSDRCCWVRASACLGGVAGLRCGARSDVLAGHRHGLQARPAG